MAKCVIVPGNGCTNVESCNWYSWAQKELSESGFFPGGVILRTMPDPHKARRSRWLPFLLNECHADSNTVVIGHSSGAVATMRLLETNRLLGAVLVAACHTDLGHQSEAISHYYPESPTSISHNTGNGGPWKWENISNNANWILQFHSTDDCFIPPKEARFVSTKTHSTYFEFNDRNHFFSPFPELIREIISKMKRSKLSDNTIINSSSPYLSNRVVNQQKSSSSSGWQRIIELGKNPKLINLGQGFPDFEGNSAARIAAESAIKAGTHDQYSTQSGSHLLKSAISNLASFTSFSENSHTLDVNNEICVMTSGTEALYCAIQAIINPGDEVVIFEPCFPWYLSQISLAGGIPVIVKLNAPHFSLVGDSDIKTRVKKAFTNKTKMVIYNSPHNPSGHCATISELQLLSNLCIEHDVICLSDEVYEIAIYNPSKARHYRIRNIDGMWERTLTVGSASKLLGLTGWRVGWLTGPSSLIEGAQTVHGFSTFCAPTPLQFGVSAGIRQLLSSKDKMNVCFIFFSNSKLFFLLSQMKGVEVCPADGGYFLTCDVSSTGMTDFEWVNYLAEEAGIVAIPLCLFMAKSSSNPTNFAHSSLVRFAICKTDETISKAV
eukprot:GSMAST32.ASY1.ANO1.1140.1 assembled CDS